VAASIAKAYGLQTTEVYDNLHFEFPRNRRDLDWIHLTSDPQIASAHTVPEVVQDALRAVWSILHRDETGGLRPTLERMRAWVDGEGRKLSAPQVLAVTMPWSALGDHGFGKKLTLREWLGFGTLADLHSKSVPIAALHGAQITPV
jgi:hypothetical protein